MQVYLDNAATTPIDPEVLDTMVAMMKNNFGNPSSIHHFGRASRAIVESSRKEVATILNVSPSEIFFTSGGTEANNMAIQCSIHDLGIRQAITSRVEHHAVLHTLQAMEKRGFVRVHYVNIDECGRVDLTHLEELLKSNPGAFVSLMHANNELGTLLPIDKAGDLCAANNAIFHSDTVQTMGHYKIDLRATPVHFVSCAAHKFHGPKGVGFIYINNQIKINPFIYGGSQERNMRGGTENIYGIAGLAKAFEIANRNIPHDLEHISSLKNHMKERLMSEIPGIRFNGDPDGQNLYTVLNVSFPPTELAEMFLFSLDIAGIAASGGSACSSGSNVGSHVLSAIGSDPARPSVRFSFSKYTTKSEIDFCIEKLKEMFSVKV
jgi:cysteine desulfurase